MQQCWQNSVNYINVITVEHSSDVMSLYTVHIEEELNSLKLSFLTMWKEVINLNRSRRHFLFYLTWENELSLNAFISMLLFSSLLFGGSPHSLKNV